MAVGDDFKVSRRYREDISELAVQWRAAGGVARDNRFDVVALLQKVVLPSLARQGRPVVVRIVDNDPSDPEAWVDLGKGEVCFQQWIWEEAQAQHERGRLVVAHEIGHLLLHGEQLHAFSHGQEMKLGFLEPTESAECQANWFASALLLPDEVLLRMSKLTNASVATLTLVSERVVEVRRQELTLDKRYRSYTGDECANCGSPHVAIKGLDAVCHECGVAASR